VILKFDFLFLSASVLLFTATIVLDNAFLSFNLN
jgi:hypothetical protein